MHQWSQPSELSFSQFSIHFTVHSSNPHLLILPMRMLWERMSKASPFLVQSITAMNGLNENDKWILLKNFKYIYFFHLYLFSQVHSLWPLSAGNFHKWKDYSWKLFSCQLWKNNSWPIIMMIMTPSEILNHHYECMITDYCSTGLLLNTQ